VGLAGRPYITDQLVGDRNSGDVECDKNHANKFRVSAWVIELGKFYGETRNSLMPESGCPSLIWAGISIVR
jgi:hypothetical protein